VFCMTAEGSGMEWSGTSFTSSAKQLGCTDVPGLSVSWSKQLVLCAYHI